MLGFVQNWFKPAGFPIGVDFGTDSLRLAQVDRVDNEFKLVAAASAEVPASVRQNPAERLKFFAETTRQLLAQGKFRGRRAVLALPAAGMFIQHLRMAKMDDADLKKALPWEARGKLPIDPGHAVLRHLVAGEVYYEQEPKLEVILMAAARDLIDQLLAAAVKAKLEVAGMNVEPKALVDCFGHVYRRKNDAEVTNCFVDIGCSGTRATVARGSQILFARSIPIGGDHFNRAVAAAMKISAEDARVLRAKLAHLAHAAAPAAGTVEDEARDKNAIADAPPEKAAAAEKAPEPTMENSFALLGAALQASRKAEGAAPAPAAPAAGALIPPDSRIGDRAIRVGEVSGPPVIDPGAMPPEMETERRAVEQACTEPLNKLVDELDLCRRYYESVFPNQPVGRLVFVGGEARHKTLCQHIARELQSAAQVGDPLVRMGRTTEVGVESGIDRRQPQPGWAVAIGLSMGPVAVKAEKK